MRVLSPRFLLACSAVLAAAFVIGLVATQRHSPGGPATTATRAAPKPPPTPPPTPSVSASAFEARVPVPDGSVVQWGPAGAQPLLWTTGGRLTGLSPNTAYTASSGGTTWSFRTTAIPPTVQARVEDGVIRLDGSPFFPLIAWQECPDRWDPDIQSGINLFGGNPCTGLENLLSAVQGRAVVAGTTEDPAGTTGPGLIGWFFADEADARGLTGESLGPGGAGIRFLTLTSHFFSLAAPLPTGRAMYPGLVARADVVGFDLYPLQELCRPELLPWVFDAQQALGQLAPGKATFQWIEEREMKCPQPEAAVTPATIRVESWLAIAGGARGLAFFPSPWHEPVTTTVHGIASRIRQLAPALLQPPEPVTVAPDAPMVRASGRTYGGAFYLIAVNAGTTAAPVRLQAPALSDRTLVAVGSGRRLRAASGELAVTLPPRSVRLYVAPPGA